jgi:hypothetical protein
VVWFVPYTTEVQPRSRQWLQQFISMMKEQDLDGYSCRIQFFVCPQERRKDSLLGYKRAERLMATITKTVAIEKERFIIQDFSASVLHGTSCENTGISIALRADK